MIVLPLLLMACEPVGPVPGQTPVGSADPRGELRVDREQLDFGLRSVIDDGPAELSFQVSNVGDGPLVVAGLHWVVPSEVFRSDGPALVELDPGEQRQINVTFDPSTEGSFDAVLFPNGEARVDLLGEATAPVAELYGGDLDVPQDVYVGCAAIAELTLVNDGSEPLRVDEISLVGSEDFQLIGEVPTSLAAGSQVRFDARFTPSQGGQQSATFQVRSNDPAAPAQGALVSFLGVRGSQVSESFVAVPPSAADLLFVVDTSETAMGDTLLEARDATEVLFEELDAGDVDWRVAISTNGAACRPTVDPYLHAGLYHDYEPSIPGDVLAFGLNAAEDAQANLLDQAVGAAAESHASGCFEGFLRDADQLHVILITRQDDTSSLSASEALAQLRSYVSEPQKLRVSAITGQGSATDCPDAAALRSAARESGGLELDLCASDWEGLFARIAELSVGVGGAPVTLPLSTSPVPSTLEVTYRGRALSAWSLDAERDEILLDLEAEGLPVGAEVSVTYLEAQPC